MYEVLNKDLKPDTFNTVVDLSSLTYLFSLDGPFSKLFHLKGLD